VTEQDPGVSHRLQTVPGHHHFAGGVRPELQVQTAHPRSADRVTRLLRELGLFGGLCAPSSDEGARRQPGSGGPGRGEEAAAAEAGGEDLAVITHAHHPDRQPVSGTTTGG